MRTESAIGLTLLAITGCTGQHTGHTPIRGNKTFPNENDGAIRAQKTEGGARRGGGGAKRQKGVGEDIPQ